MALKKPVEYFNREVSIDAHPAVQLAYEAYTGEDEESNDPFEILARREEELGMPIVFMTIYLAD